MISGQNRLRLLSALVLVGFVPLWELPCLAQGFSDLNPARSSQIKQVLVETAPVSWRHTAQTLSTTLAGFALWGVRAARWRRRSTRRGCLQRKIDFAMI